jgi:prolyl-tRNA synthetase
MIKKNSEVDTIGAANEIADTLRKGGFRVKVDSRDIRAGQKYYDWEIKGVPLRLDIGPRDISQGTVFAAKRTGGKEPLPMETIVESCRDALSEISDELRKRSSIHMDDVIQPLPEFLETDGTWSMNGKVEDGKIYQMAFDGSDAHAEIIERHTGLTFLGDATEPFDSERVCHMSGKPTTRKVILAKTY